MLHIADLVQSVVGTIVECNTAYGDFGDETAMHYQETKDYDFTVIADVRISRHSKKSDLL